MNTQNNVTITSDFPVKVRPYSERSVSSLLYIKTSLEQQGVLVPTELLAALAEKGVIV